MVSLRIVLAALAVGSGAAGLKFLKKSVQSRQTALEVLACRRNGISCLVASFLLLAIEFYIHL